MPQTWPPRIIRNPPNMPVPEWQNPTPAGTYLDYEQVTVGEDSLGELDPPDGATVALVQVQDGNVRYTRGGDPPTIGTGMILWATSPPFPFLLPSPGLKFISMDGTAKLNVEYYGAP